MFTTEELQAILSGNGEADKKVEAIVALHNDEIASLKATNQDFKTEKKALADKLAAAVELSKKYEGEVARLQEQLKQNNPDDTRKYYEDKLQETENTYKALFAEKDSVNNSLEEQVKTLSRDKLFLECMREFDEAIVSKNVDPAGIPYLRDTILGQHGSNFSKRSINDGEMTLLSDKGKTIKRALEEFLETSVGKKFVLNGNSGGGGSGSGRAPSVNGRRQVTRSEFEMMSPREQARLVSEVDIID